MIQLRKYQLNGINALWDYFYSGKKGNPLLAWPTGTGKSCVPAVFIQDVMQKFPDQKFLMITHVKELIEQNAEVLTTLWPNAPLGIYSAGLKQKDVALPIIYGGIQSMIKNPAQFGFRHIIFIDEAHLVSTEESSMYLTFLATMKLINPKLRVIGMTATPFRMGQGYITDGGLFTDIVHDITGMEAFNQLIAEGYLAPLIPLRTKMKLDISDVNITKGDFVMSQLQNAVDKNEVTYAGLTELAHAGENRRSWLIFASGIEHCEHIAQMLQSFGVECAAVHSKQDDEYNDSAIKAFKAGRLRAISNYGKLTTGFNHPGIDLIGMFRPTMSIPLWVQMLGRGTRPENGKQNCMVMDFARNTPRLGPINDPIIPKKKGPGNGDIPIKICEQCGAYNHTRVKFCCQCGSEFHFSMKLVETSGTEELLKTDQPIYVSFDVVRVVYEKKQKKDQSTPPYIRASYYCGIQTFSENVFPEHGRYATHLFHNWWKQRHISTPPNTVDDALRIVAELRTPRRIRVWVNKGKYPEVVNVEF
jgi:DNA repair protein RadD